MNSFLSHVLLAAASLLITACSSNAPTRFYLLSADSRTTGAPAAAGAAQKQVGFWKVRLPEYLDRSGIVSRLDADQLWISSNEKWAEPLSDSVTRVLSENLAKNCPAVAVIMMPQPLVENVDFEIRSSFAHFERVNDKVVAEVRIVSRQQGAAASIGKNVLRVEQDCSGQHTSDTVSCMSKALNGLSEQMSGALSAVLPCGNSGAL